jgi:hypothetical protein
LRYELSNEPTFFCLQIATALKNNFWKKRVIFFSQYCVVVEKGLTFMSHDST